MSAPVFISYSRKDLDYVRTLAEYLHNSDVPVWYDTRINPGKPFSGEIKAAIDKCAAVLLVLSPESVASDWVRREVAYATQKHKPLFPVLLAPCELPLEVSDVQVEDVVGATMPTPRFIAGLLAVATADPQPASSTAVVPKPPTQSPKPWAELLTRSIIQPEPQTEQEARERLDLFHNTLTGFFSGLFSGSTSKTTQAEAKEKFRHPADSLVATAFGAPLLLFIARYLAEHTDSTPHNKIDARYWLAGAAAVFVGLAIGVFARLLVSKSRAPFGTTMGGVWVAGLILIALWLTAGYLALAWSGLVTIPLPGWLPWHAVRTA